MTSQDSSHGSRADDKGEPTVEDLLAQVQPPAKEDQANEVAQGASQPVEDAATRSNEQVGLDVDAALAKAAAAMAGVEEPPPPGAKPFTLTNLAAASTGESGAHGVDLVRDVEMDVRIELGRSYMRLADVLKLRRGSVVALDKLAGDPVDVFVNGKLVARGEVMVMNDDFCVRVSELIGAD